jgi:hypothetical protein
MKAAAVLLMTFGLACATAATASERVTDLDYLKANRCKGLATTLGSDTTAIDSLIKVQGRSRGDAVLQRADEELTRAKREAAKPELKERLSAELSGPCLAYMSGAKDASTGR